MHSERRRACSRPPSERERSEAVLREHEQKLRAVFDTALDAIFIIDDERRYVDVNPAACEYIGVAKRDLIGRKVDEFLPPHKLATVEPDWAEYVGGGPIVDGVGDAAQRRTVRVAEASARPHFLPGLHIAFLRDVTERKRLEAELLNAQKLESLGRLAGGVAHDFNNLLTGITGYATLLLERANGDAELRRDLGQIVRAADRARGADEAAARVRAPAGAEAAAARPEHGPRRGAAAAPAAGRRGRDARDRQRRRPRDRPRRPRPDRAGDPQPRRQRQGRDAGRRPAHDRDRGTADDGQVELVFDRHRVRHGRGDHRADLRAVLHHARAGRRARPRVGLRHRPPEQRRGGGREHARRREPSSRIYPAARVRGAGAAAVALRSRHRRRARRRSCSSRTRTSFAT